MAKQFNPDAEYRGGRVNADGTPAEARPARLTYPCFAEQCPMPGTIFGFNGSQGCCAWHYAVLPHDIPKVTQVLCDWLPVSQEVERARRVHTGKYAADPKVLEAEFVAAWDRLAPKVSAWRAELDPVRPQGGRDTYVDWGKRLERFLGARVVEVLSIHQRRLA